LLGIEPNKIVYLMWPERREHVSISATFTKNYAQLHRHMIKVETKKYNKFFNLKSPSNAL
jgi:hypothetical protein